MGKQTAKRIIGIAVIIVLFCNTALSQTPVSIADEEQLLIEWQSGIWAEEPLAKSEKTLREILQTYVDKFRESHLKILREPTCYSPRHLDEFVAILPTKQEKHYFQLAIEKEKKVLQEQIDEVSSQLERLF